MASNLQSAVMSFEDFRKLLAEELLVGEEALVPQASFIADLAVDSIRLVEMILRFEELGIHVPPEAAWEIQTVGDAYNYYLKNAGDGVKS